MSRRVRNGHEITSADQVDLLFSLTCALCDAGIDIGSFDEAVQAGWREIIRDSRGPAWNYIGLCPECQSEESAE